MNSEKIIDAICTILIFLFLLSILSNLTSDYNHSYEYYPEMLETNIATW